MREEQRKDKLEEFINTQRYVYGLEYQILTDPTDDDRFIIRFKRASQRQIITLQRRFIANDMSHIHVTAIDVIEFEERPKRRKKK